MRIPLLLASLVALSGATRPPNKSCKAHPSNADWPSADDWARLNKALDGRLIKPTPPAAACHPGQPGHDPKRCAEVKKAWETTEFHCGNPVSVLLDQFTNYTCLPDAAYPCTGDGYPAYVVNATTARHIKLGVDFGTHHLFDLIKAGPLTLSFTSPEGECQTDRQRHRARLSRPLSCSRRLVHLDA